MARRTSCSAISKHQIIHNVLLLLVKWPKSTADKWFRHGPPPHPPRQNWKHIQDFDAGISTLSWASYRSRLPNAIRQDRSRCIDKDRFDIAHIDNPDVTEIGNPAGTKVKVARANLRRAEIVILHDNDFRCVLPARPI